MHDAIVIGAGPAGNVAALNLAAKGHRVIVLDWRRKIGDKLCTGIIGMECVARFPPNEAHIHRRAESASVVSPAGRRYRIVSRATQAFIIDRVAYVNSLAQLAMKAGADYKLGARVTNIETSDTGVTVSTTAGGRSDHHQAEVVIIASGFASPLVKMAGLQLPVSGNYMVGAQAVAKANSLEETEVYLGEKIAPGSFGWLVPLSDSRALMGVVSRSKLNGHINRFLSDLQSNGKVQDLVTAPQRWGIPLRPLRKTYANRALIVGDAAGLTKPTTGGGIYYSILSGELAAEAIDRSFATGDFSAGQLMYYQKRWKDVLGKELRTGYYARMLYEALGDRQIEILCAKCLSSRITEELVDSQEFSFDWHARLILKAVRHRDLWPIVSSFGPTATNFLSRLRGIRSF